MQGEAELSQGATTRCNAHNFQDDNWRLYAQIASDLEP